MAAASKGGDGFDADDVAWLLDNAGGEIVVLRPSSDDHGPAFRAPPGRRSRPVIRQRPVSRAGEMAGSR
jgi:hypothetical protein